MNDTIKMLLLPNELNCSWDITELQQRLDPYTKFHRHGFKPLGFVRGTMSVRGTNERLIVEGSLAKYFMGSNIENFDWKYVKPAIKMLAADLGLPIERGRLQRVDIGANISLDESVIDYFPELKHLRYYQRTNKRTTTLRFESNSDNVQVLFYDKLAEFNKKNTKDIEIANLRGIKNLMRYEVQLQQRVAAELGLPKLKVVHLYSTTFYKRLMNHWFLTIYCDIEKKALMVLPKHTKGRKAAGRFVYRFFVETLGWGNVEAMYNTAQANGSLSADDKSKMLKHLRCIMQDNSSFEFKNITYELNEKVSEIYLDALSQIQGIKQNNSKLI